MEDEKFIAWITRYALSGGIKEVSGTQSREFPAMITAYPNRDHYHDGDWHRTREAAVAKAEKMRVAKIASLKKQIAKLEKLRFE